MISIKNNTSGCWSWIWLKKSYLHLRCLWTTKVIVTLNTEAFASLKPFKGFFSQLAKSYQFSQDTGDLKKKLNISLKNPSGGWNEQTVQKRPERAHHSLINLIYLRKVGLTNSNQTQKNSLRAEGKCLTQFSKLEIQVLAIPVFSKDSMKDCNTNKIRTGMTK